jgi:hypothetical protein
MGDQATVWDAGFNATACTVVLDNRALEVTRRLVGWRDEPVWVEARVVRQQAVLLAVLPRPVREQPVAVGDARSDDAVLDRVEALGRFD